MLFIVFLLVLYFEVVGGVECDIFLKYGLDILVQVVNIGLTIHLELHNVD